MNKDAEKKMVAKVCLAIIREEMERDRNFFFAHAVERIGRLYKFTEEDIARLTRTDLLRGIKVNVRDRVKLN